MQLHFDGFIFKVTMKQNLTYSAELADDPVGNVTRINNALEGMAEKLEQHKTRLVRLESELKNAQEEAERPFPKEDELRQKSERLAQLNRELKSPKQRLLTSPRKMMRNRSMRTETLPCGNRPTFLLSRAGNRPSGRQYGPITHPPR